MPTPASVDDAQLGEASPRDVEARCVIDLIEGRQAPDLDRGLAERPEQWRNAVSVTVWDLHEPFRAALSHHLPDATAVADPFHVVAVRHAAPCSRGRVRDPPLRPVAAGR